MEYIAAGVVTYFIVAFYIFGYMVGYQLADLGETRVSVKVINLLLSLIWPLTLLWYFAVKD